MSNALVEIQGAKPKTSRLPRGDHNFASSSAGKSTFLKKLPCGRGTDSVALRFDEVRKREYVTDGWDVNGMICEEGSGSIHGAPSNDVSNSVALCF